MILTWYISCKRIGLEGKKGENFPNVENINTQENKSNLKY
jgi:hypothetical protein